MTAPQVRHFRIAEQPVEQLNPLISRSLITGERTMLAHVYLKKGAVVPMHSHDNEQITYVLEGALRFRMGNGGPDGLVVRTGEVLHLPSNVPHEAEALEDTIDVDVFTPPRQDWLDGDDAYLRSGGAGEGS
ncbi:MAG: cupin domain-containing protein [Gemmatimonadetes bacterium]|nr:cupin domain-containing protein [Gemmatimonadota bacterium]